jgi:voltage-gated sodium channel
MGSSTWITCSSDQLPLNCQHPQLRELINSTMADTSSPTRPQPGQSREPSNQNFEDPERSESKAWDQSTMGDYFGAMAPASAMVAPADDTLRGKVYSIINHRVFSRVIHVIIVANAIQMGVACDNNTDAWKQVWGVCDHFFTAVFALELVLQLLAKRIIYFCDPWNFLDFGVAVVAIVDTWILQVIMGNQDSSVGLIRIFRLLRLFRLTKMIKAVPELQVVVEGLIASFRPMVWILLLLLIVIYACAICCVEVIGKDTTSYKSWDASEVEIQETATTAFNNYEYFGTLLRAMVSLFNLTLLDEWSVIVRPVFETQRAMCLLFLFMVYMCTFGVLNVIIGVVVERTLNAMSEQKEEEDRVKRKGQVEQVQKLADAMFSLDEEGSGELSFDEFLAGEKSFDMKKMLGKINFPTDFTFVELFTMLDSDGSRTLNRQEFVEGTLRLIYNDQFQRDCLFAVSFGEVKEGQEKLKKDLRADFIALMEEVKRDIRGLLTEVHGAAVFKQTGMLDSTCANPSVCNEYQKSSACQCSAGHSESVTTAPGLDNKDPFKDHLHLDGLGLRALQAHSSSESGPIGAVTPKVLHKEVGTQSVIAEPKAIAVHKEAATQSEILAISKAPWEPLPGAARGSFSSFDIDVYAKNARMDKQVADEERAFASKFASFCSEYEKRLQNYDDGQNKSDKEKRLQNHHAQTQLVAGKIHETMMGSLDLSSVQNRDAHIQQLRGLVGEEVQRQLRRMITDEIHV